MASPPFPKPILTFPDQNVVLRPWHTSDAEPSAKNLTRAVWDNLSDRIPLPYEPANAAWWISHNADPSTHAATGPWDPVNGATGPAIPTNYAIVVNGEAAGGIGVEFGEGIYRRVATLGYWLGEAHWGKGIMGAVVPAFVAWTWETWGTLLRLNGEAYEFNKGSVKCLQRAGFEFEGRRRNASLKNGVICNEMIFGALRPEK